RAGRLDTALLDRRVADFLPATVTEDEFVAAAAYHWLRRWPAPGGDPWSVPTGWRLGAPAPTVLRLAASDQVRHVYLTGTPESATVRLESDDADGQARHASLTAALHGDRLTLTVDGLRRAHRVAEADGQVWVSTGGSVAVLREVAEASVRSDA